MEILKALLSCVEGRRSGINLIKQLLSSLTSLRSFPLCQRSWDLPTLRRLEALPFRKELFEVSGTRVRTKDVFLADEQLQRFSPLYL